MRRVTTNMKMPSKLSIIVLTIVLIAIYLVYMRYTSIFGKEGYFNSKESSKSKKYSDVNSMNYLCISTGGSFNYPNRSCDCKADNKYFNDVLGCKLISNKDTCEQTSGTWDNDNMKCTCPTNKFLVVERGCSYNSKEDACTYTNGTWNSKKLSCSCVSPTKWNKDPFLLRGCVN